MELGSSEANQGKTRFSWDKSGEHRNNLKIPKPNVDSTKLI